MFVASFAYAGRTPGAGLTIGEGVTSCNLQQEQYISEHNLTYTIVIYYYWAGGFFLWGVQPEDMHGRGNKFISSYSVISASHPGPRRRAA